MKPGAEPIPIGLRIDVDFACELPRAIPLMLDRLNRAGMRATFFVAAGGHTPGRRFLHRLIADRWRRYRRLGLWDILTRMGLPSIGLTGDRLIRFGDLLKRIPAEGHELGVHGFDHGWWADRVWQAPPSALESEIDRAYAAFRSATGRDDQAWASPNWRTTADVLTRLEQRKVPYFSDCWGSGPFLTRLTPDRTLPTPHLPITLPSLESLILARRLPPHEAVAAVFDGRPWDRTRPGGDVMCMHGYYEGLLQPALLPLFLEECVSRNLRTVTLKELAAGLAAETLPACRLTRGPLPGFVGPVSLQEPPSNET